MLTCGELVNVAIKGWDNFLLPLFLTVKGDLVPARFQKQLVAALASRLE